MKEYIVPGIELVEYDVEDCLSDSLPSTGKDPIYVDIPDEGIETEWEDVSSILDGLF